MRGMPSTEAAHPALTTARARRAVDRSTTVCLPSLSTLTCAKAVQRHRVPDGGVDPNTRFTREVPAVRLRRTHKPYPFQDSIFTSQMPPRASFTSSTGLADLNTSIVAKPDAAHVIVGNEVIARQLLMGCERMERRERLTFTFQEDHSSDGMENGSLIRPSPSSFGHPLTASVRCSPSAGLTVAGAPPPDDKSDHYEPWVVVNSHTLVLMGARKFSKAFLAISAALPSYKGDAMKEAVLHARRALCSYALMNYKECIQDCQACVCRLTTDLQSASVSGSVNAFELYLCWFKALLLCEDYAQVEDLCQVVMANDSKDGGPQARAPVGLPLSSADRDTFRHWMDTITYVRAFRQCIEQEAWPAALVYSAKANCTIESTPLVPLQSAALLECGRFEEARETLLHYISSVPEPLSTEEAANASPEERQLRSNTVSHYLLTSTLLAKASIYNGLHYLNIAAVLTNRCLQINPIYAKATALGNYLVELEECLSRIDSNIKEGTYTDAVNVINFACTLDPANRRINAILLLRRAECNMRLNRPLLAVEDCTLSIKLDAMSAKAYMMRASLYDLVQQSEEAAADREMAVRLNPSYETVLREAAEMRRRQADEADAERLRRQFAATAAQRQPVPPPARTHHGPFSLCGHACPPHFQPSFQPSASGPPFGDRGYPGGGSMPSSSAHNQGPRAEAFQPPRRGVPAAMSLYDVLGVSRLATYEDIRRSFKKLTLQCHPDRLIGETEEAQRQALEQFKLINHAHNVLSDTSKRAAYDLSMSHVGR